MTVRILEGDCIEQMRTLDAGSAQVCITSPPYFGLRAYGTNPKVWGGDPEHGHTWGTVPSPGARSSDTKPGPLQHAGNKGRERLASDVCACGAWRGELGLEPTPVLFIEHLVAVFEEVRRVLRDDGTLWVNLGDSYANDAKWGGSSGGKHVKPLHGQTGIGRQKRETGVPPKSLFLIPERFVIAMQEAGWYVRSKIVWSKASCMPESVKDRPTSAWEPIFLFAKSRTYFYDAEAVRTENGANLRNVWHLGPEPSRLEHYAAFPTAIPRTAILAGTSEKGACPACGAPWRRVVERTPPDSGRGRQAWTAGATAHPQRDSHGGLQPVAPITLGWEPACRCEAGDPRPCVVIDPFGGSGTTGLVADRLGRDAVLIELNGEYVKLARNRIQGDAPLFAEVSA